MKGGELLDKTRLEGDVDCELEGAEGSGVEGVREEVAPETGHALHHEHCPECLADRGERSGVRCVADVEHSGLEDLQGVGEEGRARTSQEGGDREGGGGVVREGVEEEETEAVEGAGPEDAHREGVSGAFLTEDGKGGGFFLRGELVREVTSEGDTHSDILVEMEGIRSDACCY